MMNQVKWGLNRESSVKWVCYEYFTSICMNEGANRVCSYSVCMFSVSTRDYKGSEFYYVLYMMKY